MMLETKMALAVRTKRMIACFGAGIRLALATCNDSSEGTAGLNGDGAAILGSEVAATGERGDGPWALARAHVRMRSVMGSVWVSISRQQSLTKNREPHLRMRVTSKTCSLPILATRF